VLLAGYAVIVLGWSLLRLPETLHPEDRRSLRPGAILEATRIVFTDRLAVGYTLASTALFGGLMAYIASIQQIVADAFHQPTRVPLVFAACAAPMAGAAFANSRIVGRFGLRQVGHAGLAAFLLVSAIHWGAAQGGSESLFLFVTLQGLAMIAFAFCSSNFSTLAMTNMEAIAGTASSVLGVTSSVGGALIGLTIGQAFNGTAVPFLMGMLLCGLGALTVVALTERGRLFEKLAIAAQS
jgi:DHA1 family bicyclomycin/chloramphenicol resistance-like MFS transporter